MLSRSVRNCPAERRAGLFKSLHRLANLTIVSMTYNMKIRLRWRTPLAPDLPARAKRLLRSGYKRWKCPIALYTRLPPGYPAAVKVSEPINKPD